MKIVPTALNGSVVQLCKTKYVSWFINCGLFLMWCCFVPVGVMKVTEGCVHWRPNHQGWFGNLNGFKDALLMYIPVHIPQDPFSSEHLTSIAYSGTKSYLLAWQVTHGGEYTSVTMPLTTNCIDAMTHCLAMLMYSFVLQ